MERSRKPRPPGRHRRAVLALALGALLVSASCSGGGGEDASSGVSDPGGADAGRLDEAAAPAPGSDAEAGGGGGASDQRPGNVDVASIRTSRREVVHTASVDVRVDDVEQAVRAATSIVEGAGGYLFAQDADLDDDPVATATFKVPPESFAAVLDDFGELGDVQTRSVDSEDVTGQAVDLEARVAAARTSAERLRNLLRETGSVADLLEVERVLAERDADVEALEAQLAELEARVELATITLTVTAPHTTAKEPDDRDATGFVGALRDGWGALVAASGGLLVALGYTLPFLALGGLAAGVVVVVRRRRRTAPAS